MARTLPIVYVRGFGGGQAGIDSLVEDPFYGFNVGSTHVRVGGGGEPAFYQFESPLLRLMLDHGYTLHVKGGQLSWLRAQPDGTVPEASVWIHRFYDEAASTFGRDPQRYRLEGAAEDLLDLVELVRRKTGAPRVHLVAHSMGGLVCRSLLQKVVPERGGRATDLVDRLFTYATPHGGIEFAVGFGLLERARDLLGVQGADIFGPARMWEYLHPSGAGEAPPDWDPRDIPEAAFPRDRVFTLVGTNPEDYDVALGLSSKAVGVKSDGLVQIENAYVPGARFAYVHRSHSGRYGIVNSEEGYQNLRRFLLGDLEVTADLVGLRLPAAGAGGPEDLVWQADVELAVRGLPVLMHQQVAAHHCPVILDLPADEADRPQPLVTTFLIADPAVRPEDAGTVRYTLHVRLFSVRQHRGIFDFGDHLEQTADFDDWLVVDIGVLDEGLAAWAAWVSELPVTLRDYVPDGPPLADEDAAPGRWVKRLPLPPAARRIFGEAAALQLTVRARAGQDAAAPDAPA
ncbi:alpha/beta hydrolase [Citricoccus sp. SGAir0253]|uniref:esterase/lipase family protein n=1 Tax=Citricoccus sp. SGAir0253 TaxID=2567881 RepID=UPI0010CD0780|nr:alpha/beta fold hydrolase [Citricoccus sp. SGAir0253]QCU78300.1 alpha/beta hydrolase [Citricoccus sp. SGAir0253]